MLIRIVLVFFIVVSSQATAETVYVSYRWAGEGAVALTESWAILQMQGSTRTESGMNRLIQILADEKGVDTVVVTYVRELMEEAPEETGSGSSTGPSFRMKGTPI